MKALLLDAENRTATLSTLPLPTPGPGELLIAVKAIALNPVDAQSTTTTTHQSLGRTGRVIGSDFAGLVVARGGPLPNPSSSSSSGRRRSSAGSHEHTIGRGDRVAGFLPGAAASANNERQQQQHGAFAEYVVCPADLVWRVPAHVGYEEAAGVSLCGLAAAQGLFFRLGWEAPFQWEDESDEAVLRRIEREQEEDEEEEEEEEVWFFVAGASTSVGMYVAQLARRSAEMSGKRVRLVGAASPRNWQMLKAEPYGYEVLVDYRDASWPDQVRLATGGEGVHFAYDAISERATVRDVSTTLRKGGKMAVVRPKAAGAWDADGVVGSEPLYGAVWEGLGEDLVESHHLPISSSPAKRSFAASFYKWLSDGGMLHPNPVRVMPGGLERVVQDGFALLETNVSSGRSHESVEEHMRPISGEKLVYRILGERRDSTGEGFVG